MKWFRSWTSTAGDAAPGRKANGSRSIGHYHGYPGWMDGWMDDGDDADGMWPSYRPVALDGEFFNDLRAE